RVRLLLTGDHPEQRRLPRSIRPDDADDPAARKGEVEIVDQQIVAVAFAELPGFDDHVAEARAGRDVNFGRLDLLSRLLAEQILVRVQTSFTLRLPRPWRHANPLELAFERALLLRLRLLFLLQPLPFLLQPGRI